MTKKKMKKKELKRLFDEIENLPETEEPDEDFFKRKILFTIKNKTDFETLHDRIPEGSILISKIAGEFCSWFYNPTESPNENLFICDGDFNRLMGELDAYRIEKRFKGDIFFDKDGDWQKTFPVVDNRDKKKKKK